MEKELLEKYVESLTDYNELLREYRDLDLVLTHIRGILCKYSLYEDHNVTPYTYSRVADNITMEETRDAIREIYTVLMYCYPPMYKSIRKQLEIEAREREARENDTTTSK